MPFPNRTAIRLVAIAAAVLLAAHAGLAAAANTTAQTSPQPAPAKGVIRLKNANSCDETLVRLKADVQAKGIRFLDAIDQSGLGPRPSSRLRYRSAIADKDAQFKMAGEVAGSIAAAATSRGGRSG